MNILTYFEKFNYTISAKNEISISCPVCGKDNNHFNINTLTGLCHCFKCGYSDNHIGLVAKLEGISFNEAKDLFILPKTKISKTVSCELPEMQLPIRSEWTLRSKFYLQERNIYDSTIDYFGLYYCNSGWFGGRIIIPIYFNDKVVSFQARSILGSKKKYLFPKGSPTGRILYNYDNIKENSDIVLVEGMFDVMALWQKNINAIATFGKQITDRQLHLLETKTPNSLTLMYDSDAVGEIDKVFQKLNKKFKTSIALLLDGDPADCKDPQYYIDNSITNPRDIFLHLLEVNIGTMDVCLRC